MSDCNQFKKAYSRRDFLSTTTMGLGAAALGSLFTSAQLPVIRDPGIGILKQLHYAPRAKRVIYLFQSGGPSQMDLFDHKPLLAERDGEELPESVRQGQRLTGMTSGQKSFPLVGSPFKFSRHGQSGAWISELLPHIAQVSDELCFIKSMYTEAINHDPAITFFQTGSQQAGRPSIGSWISYGLGSSNDNLPTFCVLLSEGRGGSQPLYSRLWNNGFLPSIHQGVQFRSGNDPVLFLSNPPGIDQQDRERQLSYLQQMHRMQLERTQDPELQSRMAQYEMAYRMQTSVPETMEIKNEPESYL